MRKSVILSLSLLSTIACGNKKDSSQTASSGTAAAASATATSKSPPLAQGHVNQDDGKGGWIAPKAPPPPRAAPQAVAFAPSDLPALNAHKPTLPPKPTTGEGHCGEYKVNGQLVHLNCMDATNTQVPQALTPIGSHQELAGAAGKVGAKALPAAVDHRADGTEGRILNQYKTEACTSFSLAGVVNHEIGRLTGKPGDVSMMHSWARYHQARMDLAANANIGHGLAPWGAWPYDEKAVNDMMAGKGLDDAKVKALDPSAVASVTHIQQINFQDPNEVKAVLASGHDVWFALGGAAGLFAPFGGKPGALFVPDYDRTKFPKGQDGGGHAIRLVGYRPGPDGSYYIIANSWGDAWADKGYVLMHEKTFAKNAFAAYAVSVAMNGAPSHPGTHSSCATGTVPDSLTGQCVPPCPDKSPRYNGVCGSTAQCEAGEVNISGSCVTAAPTRSADLKTQHGTTYHVDCAPAGCTYTYAKGTFGCTDATCHLSCAAPTFIPAHDANDTKIICGDPQ